MDLFYYELAGSSTSQPANSLSVGRFRNRIVVQLLLLLLLEWCTRWDVQKWRFCMHPWINQENSWTKPNVDNFSRSVTFKSTTNYVTNPPQLLKTKWTNLVRGVICTKARAATPRLLPHQLPSLRITNPPLIVSDFILKYIAGLGRGINLRRTCTG